MYIKLLNNVIYWTYGLYLKFTRSADYSIIKEEIEYILDHRRKYLLEDVFWERESRGWSKSLNEYHSEVTRLDFRNTCVPQNVKKIVVRIKYWYNNKIYKFISYDISKNIPKEKNISFSIPFVSAFLLDRDDKPVCDVSEKIRRYAGPHTNFHGEVVLIKDLLYYSDETLQNEYPFIKVTNMIGNTKKISTISGTTTDLLLI